LKFSISVQSTFAIGAVLNATFGSIIELVLYCSAIKFGSLDELVQSAVTGSLLATMLLLPGLSMVSGGLKYKEQRFNSAAAGVSSVLLIISVIGKTFDLID
jgi:Ca2+:H+ antiporter